MEQINKTYERLLWVGRETNEERERDRENYEANMNENETKLM